MPRSRAVCPITPGAPNRSKYACVCDRPSKMIDETPERDERHVGRRPAGLEESAPERPGRTSPSSSTRRQCARRPRRRNQTVNVSPSRAPFVAAELGHHRQGERGVADEHDEQGRRTRLVDEFEPDEAQEPDRRRPPTETGRVVGRRPALHAETGQDRGADVMERRERVEEVPDRAEDRAHDRHPDPAIDPQEEGRDVAVARAAGDPLGDDPAPSDQADRPQPEA